MSFLKEEKNAKDEKFLKKTRNEKWGVTSFFLSQKSEMAKDGIMRLPYECDGGLVCALHHQPNGITNDLESTVMFE